MLILLGMTRPHGGVYVRGLSATADGRNLGKGMSLEMMLLVGVLLLAIAVLVL